MTIWLGRRALACALMLGVGCPAAWADETARPHAFIQGTFSSVDEDRLTDDHANGWQLGFGLPLSHRFWLEGLYFDNTMETGNGSGTDFYQRGLGLDLQYAFGDRESFTPFILIGGGAARNDVIPDALDDDTFYLNAGIGVVGRLFGMQWLRYRIEGRYVRDDYLDGVDDIRGAAGIEIALGKTRVEEKVIVRDAPPPQVVEKIVEVPIAPMDSDGDGVADQFDQCPSTLAGTQVNGFGCVVGQQTVELEDVSFEFDSARLSLNGKRLLEPALLFLQNQPGVTAEIAGHTDSVGTEVYNLKLSQQRAESVRQFFIDNGIAANRLIAKGYGEAIPVESNETEEGREANRRVELHINGAEE